MSILASIQAAPVVHHANQQRHARGPRIPGAARHHGQAKDAEHQPLMLQPPGQHKAERRRRSAGARLDEVLHQRAEMAPEFRVAQEGDKSLYRMPGAAQEGSKATQGTRVASHNN